MNSATTDSLPKQLGSLFARIADRHYVVAKLRSDPLYDAVFRELDHSPLPLLDIGCGLGLLAFYLRSRGFMAPILALDYDQRKIAEAQRIGTEHGFQALQFRHFDVREGLPDHSGNVTGLDMLQFFEPGELHHLLRAAADRVAPGGSLIVRSSIRDRSWRHRFTVAGDILAKGTLWMKSGPIHYPAREDFEQVLCPLGDLSITPLWGRTPFNSHLILFRRAPSPA